ncbi:MAG: 50S ribosomal protein L15 [Kiritimatiellaeota bacterium]|nr:50S ribosomal protein L15 [Kiritimatiellota bacterium]
MKLHDLKNTVPRKSRKRVGRGDGSGHGRSCGRGDKGAGARAGNKRRPYFEGGQLPFFRRLPKRGFNNPNHQVYSVVNVCCLDENFAAGDVVTVEILRRKGMLRSAAAGVKILGDGEISKALSVEAHKFSASARQKIEAAGGTCEVLSAGSRKPRPKDDDKG